MIMFNKAYAKVWKVFDNSYSISTGDKQQDGTYRNSNWNMRLTGKVKDIKLDEGDRIEIKGGKLENVWDSEKKRNWLNLYVWDLEKQGEDEGGFYPVPEDDGQSDLPF